MMIRLAKESEIDAVARGYEDLFDHEDAAGTATNWRRGVYPTRGTAQNACAKGWLYVLVNGEGDVCASMVVNHEQAEPYTRVNWLYPAKPDEVLVLHTLCVPPVHMGKGYGSRMVRFLLAHARQTGMRAVRLDTFEGNAPAARLYERLGFRYAGRLDVVHEGVIPQTQIFFEIAVSAEERADA